MSSDDDCFRFGARRPACGITGRSCGMSRANCRTRRRHHGRSCGIVPGYVLATSSGAGKEPPSAPPFRIRGSPRGMRHHGPLPRESTRPNTYTPQASRKFLAPACGRQALAGKHTPRAANIRRHHGALLQLVGFRLDRPVYLACFVQTFWQQLVKIGSKLDKPLRIR